MSAKPSIVSPLTGVGISGSCMIAPPTSAETAVGRATTSRHQGRAIVGAAGVERGRDERARGVVGSGALAQELGDALIGQEPVHAVAAQEEAVVQGDRLRRVVQPHLRLRAERAREHA